MSVNGVGPNKSGSANDRNVSCAMAMGLDSPRTCCFWVPSRMMLFLFEALRDGVGFWCAETEDI